MRDRIIRLYVDEAEMNMIEKVARERDLPINRLIRDALAREVAVYFPISQAQLFNRVYTKRDENYQEAN